MTAAPTPPLRPRPRLASPRDADRHPQVPTAERDRRLTRRIADWFTKHGRDLPWRRDKLGGEDSATPGPAVSKRGTPNSPLLTHPPSRRDAYRSLVSELMLQQTQVSRVLERFEPFIARFPTLRQLAAADEADVLAQWSGLGYYRRARHLHAAARDIVDRFGGAVPDDPAALRTLPGVGRYTAGAVASIVFGHPEPIVDGNVARVLLRIDGRELPAQQGADWAWARAEALVRNAAGCPGPAAPAGSIVPLFNEGLMELGATVCLPRSPRCDACPVRADCRAAELGLQGRIPRPKPPAPRRAMFCAAVLVRDGRNRLLVERRDDKGMWAGLWQAPTLETRKRASRRTVEAWIGAPVRHLDRFDHGATHRDVRFDVWTTEELLDRPGAVYRTPRHIASLGLSNAMRRILLEPPRSR